MLFDEDECQVNCFCVMIVSQSLYLSLINEAEKSCDVIKRGDNYFENLPIYCPGFHPK